MRRLTLSSTLLAGLVLTVGCAQDPPSPTNTVPNKPATTPEKKSEGGLHIDVPGVKVDVERKREDGQKRKLNVDVEVKP